MFSMTPRPPLQVSALVGELASKLVAQPAATEPYRPELRREGSTVWQPPKQKVSDAL